MAVAAPGAEDVRREAPRWWVALLLATGTGLLFAQVAGHQFLHYDDNVYVTENPHVLRGISWSGLVWAFTSPDAWYGFPLAWLSHMLDVQLFGPSPAAHHLVNVLLHALNVALLYRVLARMTAMPGRSAIVAAIFAVHPLQVEAVAWISERKELLSTLLGLLTLWAYARYAQRPSVRRYVLVALVFAASLMAKPMWVTMPFLLLLFDAWPLRRVEGLMAVAACVDLPSARASTSSARADPRTARPEPVEGRAVVGSTRAITAISRLALEKVPLLVIAAASSVVAFLAQQHGGALRGTELSFGSRIAYAPVSYVLYLGKALWPSSLSVHYPHPGASLPGWQAVGAMLLLGIATVLALRQARRRPWIPVGWLWFAGMLVPVIGLVKAGRHGIADRYMYAPSIGLFVAAVWILAELGERFGVTRALRVLAAAVVLALAALSLRQQAYWSDHVTLFTHAVEVTPDDGLAHHILSQGLAAQGRYPEALVHAREAARLEPGISRVHKNLGYVLYRLGLVDEAIEAFRSAIAIEPDYAEAHGNLGFAYAKKGWSEAAMKELSIERQLEGQAEGVVNR